MPIPGQAVLITINGAKDQKITYQPLLLAELLMADGTFRRFATENLSLTTGGHQYKGKDWVPRIMSETLGALQSVSDQGIVQMPNISIKLMDADGGLWNDDELTVGFKGAKITLKFVFWDPDTNVFSTDEQVKFVGVCDAPKSDHNSLTLTAKNILNLANFNLPVTRIGRTCPWIFPTNHADRVRAALDPDSDFFECGYSPDVTDADGPGGTAAARGNGSFTDCDYTWQGCIARLGNIGAPDHSNSPSIFVQIEKDQAGRRTGRFGGIHYDPPESWRGREFTSGNVSESINNPNDAKFTDYFPMVYGTAFVSPPVMSSNGSANFTRFETVLSVGLVQSNLALKDPIQLVIVNDFIVPFRSESKDPSILGWSWVNGGARDGLVNRDTIFDGRGDCYGSIAALSITVPKKAQDSSGIPNVRVLYGGQQIKSWTSADPNDFVKGPQHNPAWVLVDLLTWISPKLSDIDLQSFLDAANVCTPMVSYTDLTQQTKSHERYKLGLTLRQRRSAAEIVNNVLASCKGMLAANGGISEGTSGKLQLYIKQTMADQQGSPVDGSNDNVPFPSAMANGAAKDGYFAYSFSENNILLQGTDRDSPTSFQIDQRPISDTPGRLGMDIQDEDFSYTTDSLSVIDAEEIGRARQEVSGGVAAEGIVNFDQGQRIIQTNFAESFRGNPRSGINSANDTGGTWIAQFDVSFRAVHLRIGHIVSISFAKYQLDRQPFRILSLSPSANFEKITIRAQWHEDDWYLDSYGQHPDPILQAQRKHRLARPPNAWLPDTAAPLDGDSLFSPTEKSYGLAQIYQTAADNTSIAKVQITGKEPVNDFSAKTSAPFVPQGESDTGGMGANIPDGHYYMSLVGVDEDGKLTGPSWPPAQATATGGGSKLTYPNIYWHPGTVGWIAYAGTNPNKLSKQAHGSGTPSSISIGDFLVAGEAAPDVEFNHIEVRVKKVNHAGILGAAITALTATSITIDAIPGISLVGRTLSILGRVNTSDDLPIWNFPITSNSGAVINLGGVTDLTALNPAPKVDDVIVVRTRPTIFDPINNNIIGDSGFVNGVDYFDPPLTIVDATPTTPITLTLATAHGYISGDKVFVKEVQGNDGANGTFATITVPATLDEGYNATHIILDGSVGTGNYGGGGTIQLITNGMRPHFEIGNEILIIAGTGRGQRRRIIDNDHTTCTIDGIFDIPPDNTSVYLIMEPGWIAFADTVPMVNADPTITTQLFIPVDNYAGQILWTQAFTESVDGKESIDPDSPGRDIFIFGGPGDVITQFDKATFNIAVSADLVVANNVAPPLEARTSGTPLACRCKLKVPSIDQDVHIQIRIVKADASYSGTIFDAGTPYLIIPAGFTDWVEISTFHTGLKFAQHDEFVLDILQIGTTQAGRVLTASVKWEIG